MDNLYSLETGEARKVCGGNVGTNDPESCVTLAHIPGAPGAVAIGDSKRPELTPLRFTPAEHLAFITSEAERLGIV